MTDSNIKPNIFLLNSPVITNFGLWRFDGPIKLTEVQDYLKNGFVSGVGHQATADYLSELLSINCPFKREQIAMQLGDFAIVLQLLCRLPEGKLIKRDELSLLPYQFGLLRRLE
jgi:hypothetical protein